MSSWLHALRHHTFAANLPDTLVSLAPGARPCSFRGAGAHGTRVTVGDLFGGRLNAPAGVVGQRLARGPASRRR